MISMLTCGTYFPHSSAISFFFLPYNTLRAARAPACLTMQYLRDCLSNTPRACIFLRPAVLYRGFVHNAPRFRAFLGKAAGSSSEHRFVTSVTSAKNSNRAGKTVRKMVRAFSFNNNPALYLIRKFDRLTDLFAIQQ